MLYLNIFYLTILFSLSLYIAYLIHAKGNTLIDKTIALFSYGSGAMASLFEIKLRVPTTPSISEKFHLNHIQKILNLTSRLTTRQKCLPNQLTEALDIREKTSLYIPYNPFCNIEMLYPGTFFLRKITQNYERVYEMKPLTEEQLKGGDMFTNIKKSYLTTNGDGGEDFYDDLMIEGLSIDVPLSGKLDTKLDPKDTDLSPNTLHENSFGQLKKDVFPSPLMKPNSRSNMKRNDTVVWASGKHLVKVVVTGVAAVLPGRNKPAIIKDGENNIHRIINGENFISEIPTDVRDAMLDKNVIESVKNKTTGLIEKKRISTYAENINLCAAMGNFDLSEYGVSESIANTMDYAVQVAIIAGLEALKHSGIVTGKGPNGWVLPAHFQDTTGVVFATSFPALDTAIAEVSKFYESKSSLSSQKINEIIKILKEKFRLQLQHLQTYPLTGNNTTTEIDQNNHNKDSIVLTKEIEDAIEALVLAGQEMAEVTCLHSDKNTIINDTNNTNNPSEQDQNSTKSINGKEFQPYEFDRKFLFRVLVLGNAQLAQIVKAKGPNMQTNAACAGATQAIALAYDMIQVGRAERVIVIAGDNASSDTLMPWLGNGFRALGAATIQSDVSIVGRGSLCISRCVYTYIYIFLYLYINIFNDDVHHALKIQNYKHLHIYRTIRLLCIFSYSCNMQ